RRHGDRRLVDRLVPRPGRARRHAHGHHRRRVPPDGAADRFLTPAHYAEGTDTLGRMCPGYDRPDLAGGSCTSSPLPAVLETCPCPVVLRLFLRCLPLSP